MAYLKAVFSILIVAVTVFGGALSAFAHDAGADLNKIIGDKETYFQAIDKPAPTFELQDSEGNRVGIKALSGKVVVLNFIYASCPDVCPLHSEKIADIQAKINASPMKDVVQFVTITTDPENDTPEVIGSYGAIHGLEDTNWVFLTRKLGQSEDATRQLAQEFGHKFTPNDGGYQTHSIVTHVIDTDGHWAANFYGLRFDSVNFVLYVNGLINKAYGPQEKPDENWWEKVRSWF
ncbi:SCO family protein [Limibacillus sp. MBR-115]|jgi:protein SCO1/2|uniref:SCO family protein n=1 Tax=Limibacillus sp. MBR-115 TaxID=3156465 RepID=UPI003390B0AD